MSKKQKRTSRRAYLNDFRLTDDGTYSYEGVHYKREGSLTSTLLFSVGAAIAAIVSGLIPFEPMLNTFYVILPFLGEIICSVCLVWNVSRAVSHRETLREYIYKKSVVRVHPFCIALTVFSSLCVVTSVIFLTLYGVSNVLWTALFLLCTLISLACGVYCAKAVKKITWQKVEPARRSVLDD
ncbi:MAG: hypothetical protein IKT43_03120 [Clostridia bacterium]|nr:hypothetical protein [Clostridia bacterium]